MSIQKKTYCELSKITRIKTGVFAKPSLAGVEVRYLQARDFDTFGEINTNSKPQFFPEGDLKKHLLLNGDILLATKGMRNFATVFRSDMGPAVASPSFFWIRILEPARNLILPDYLTWFLNTKRAQSLLKAKVQGSNLLSVTIKNVSDLPIPLPPIHVQESVLIINDLRIKEKQLISEIEDLKESYLQSKLFEAIKKTREPYAE